LEGKFKRVENSGFEIKVYVFGLKKNGL